MAWDMVIGYTLNHRKRNNQGNESNDRSRWKVTAHVYKTGRRMQLPSLKFVILVNTGLPVENNMSESLIIPLYHHYVTVMEELYSRKRPKDARPC
jgi:hypothetical protein